MSSLLNRKSLDASEWSSCAKSGEISLLQDKMLKKEEIDGKAAALKDEGREELNKVSKVIINNNRI